MRENRTYGSEGGEVVIGLSYPYQLVIHAKRTSVPSPPAGEG